MKAHENGYFPNIYPPSRERFREPLLHELCLPSISSPQEKGSEPLAWKLTKIAISQLFNLPQENGSGNPLHESLRNGHFSIIHSPSREWFREPPLWELHFPSISYNQEKGSRIETLGQMWGLWPANESISKGIRLRIGTLGQKWVPLSEL